MGDNPPMTKPRISDPALLAEARRLLDLTADQRAEIAREQAEKDIEDAENPEEAEHVRRYGVTPPEQS